MKFHVILILTTMAVFSSCNNRNGDDQQRIHHFRNFSSEYVAARNVEVWLPEGYDATKEYDVLYMHDGQNIFNPETSYTGISWEVGEAMDSLIKNGVISPAVVVAVWNTEKRFQEYMPNKPKEKIEQLLRESPEPVAILSDEYLQFIVKELKPFIDSTFSTKTQRENTFIAGSSMGGLISLYAICEYPEVFGGAACLSTHWPIGEGVVLEYLENNLPDPETHLLYFDYGTQNLDSLYKPYQQKVDQMLLEKGYEFSNNAISLEFEGADHNEAAWRERIHIPLEFLLGKK